MPRTHSLDEASSPESAAAKPASPPPIPTLAEHSPHAHTHAHTAATAAASPSSASTSRRSRVVPNSVDKYELGDELGRGGYGVVLSAHDRRLRREVAIKLLFRADDTAAEVRFAEEAQITGQLQHPNIVPVYELGEDAHGRPFLAMKRVHGREFADVIANAHDHLTRRADPSPALIELTFRRLLGVFVKVCDAVAYAHSRGVIHRDLKPANIMVGEFGEVLVMDWGLAKTIDAPAPHALAQSARRGTTTSRHQRIVSDRQLSGFVTLDGMLAGTPHYMAPEQTRGRSAALDEGADIYALGGILYTILTNDVPVDGDSLEVIVTAVAENRIVPPSKRTAHLNIPRELEAVARKAMAAHRRDRYATVTELKADIERYLEGVALSAIRYSPWQRLAKWVKRNRVAVLGATATGIMALIGILGAVLSAAWTRDAEQRHQQVEQENYLAARAAEWAAIDAELAALVATADAGQFEVAVAGLKALASSRANTLEALKRNDQLLASRPEIPAAATAFTERVRTARRDAVRKWAAARVPTLPAVADVPAERLTAVEADYRRFAAFANEPGLAELPVAEFAAWRADAAFAMGDFDTAVRWVANAYIAAPESRAAGRAFMRLAGYSLAIDDFHQAARQYHLALSSFGDRHPDLRPAALFGLARALANLGGDAMAPFAPTITAREMALRAVLQILDANGRLRPAFAGNPACTPEWVREVADWLFVLRRITREVPAHWDFTIDLDGDFVPDAVCMSRGALTVSIARPWVGDDGRSTVFDEVAAFDLAPLVRAVAPSHASEHLACRGAWAVRLVPGTELPQFVFALHDSRTRDYLMLAVEHPSAERPLFGFVEPNSEGSLFRHSVTAGDLNGDGRPDVAFGFTMWSRRIVVGLQIGDRQFAFQPLPTSPNETGSDTQAVVIGDFDGDGPNELLVVRGPWNSYAIEWFRADRRSLLGADAKFIGFCDGIVPIRTADGGIIVAAAPQCGAEMAAGFTDTMKLESIDLNWWTVRDKKLQRVPNATIPRAADFADGREMIARPLVAVREAGRFALVEQMNEYDWIRKRSRHRLFWHLWDGDEPGESAPRTVAVDQLDDADLCLPEWIKVGRRAYVPISPGDLDRLAALGVPASTARTSAHVAVTIARTLVDVGLPGEALPFIDATLAAPTADDLPAETRRELQGARLDCLAHLDRPGDLMAMLRDLPPDDALVGGVLVAAETLAVAHAEFDFAATILARWAALPSLPEGYRNLLQRRAGEWAAAHAQVTTPAISWDGPMIRAGASAPVAVGHFLLANRPYMLLPPAAAAAVPDAVSRGRLPMVMGGWRPWVVRETKSGAEVLRPVGCVGVPVRFDGGSWRITVDWQLDGTEWASGGAIGLFALDQLADPARNAEPRAGLKFATMGGNMIFRCIMMLNPPGERETDWLADAAIGRPLRVDYIYLANEGQLHVTVADRETGTVLVATRTAKAALAPGAYLFGIAGHSQYNGRAEGMFDRAFFAGEFSLLSPDDPAVQSVFDALPDVAAISRIEGAMLTAAITGNAEEWRQAADARREWLAEVPVMIDENAWANWHPVWADFDAAFAAGNLSAGAFADALAARVGANTARVPYRLLAWLLSQPTFAASDAAWVGAGKFLARHIAPGESAAEWSRNLRARVDANAMPLHAGLLIAHWVLAELPDDMGARVFAVIAGVSVERATTETPSPVMRFRMMALAGKVAGDGPPPQIGASAFGAYSRFLALRRADGFSKLTPANRGQIGENTIEWQRRLHDWRTRHLDWHRTRAAQRAAAFPHLPGE